MKTYPHSKKFAVKTAKLSALMAALILPISASANNLAPPPSYSTGCGSCHVPYPPNLLSARGWRGIMDGLGAHFGENVKLEEPARQQAEEYLVNQAGRSRYRFGSRTNPPRLSSTLWFRRTHGEVKSDFANPNVGSPANCRACHTQAEHGEYAKKGVIPPERSQVVQAGL